MWLKKKDKVIVLSGKDRGKRGEVLSRHDENRFIVSKVNIVKRHQRGRQDQKAGIIEKEAPIHQSKLMLICPKCDSTTSPKIDFLKDKTKVRVCRNCSEVLE